MLRLIQEISFFVELFPIKLNKIVEWENLQENLN